mmetsp:Transcript_18787/g.37871  ORF Transcript_18787/g.37871 Transcript_18787/m.37871 type:complete len:220 (-) Transcript_18787:1988-2647(-)
MIDVAFSSDFEPGVHLQNNSMTGLTFSIHSTELCGQNGFHFCPGRFKYRPFSASKVIDSYWPKSPSTHSLLAPLTMWTARSRRADSAAKIRSSSSVKTDENGQILSLSPTLFSEASSCFSIRPSKSKKRALVPCEFSKKKRAVNIGKWSASLPMPEPSVCSPAEHCNSRNILRAHVWASFCKMALRIRSVTSHLDSSSRTSPLVSSKPTWMASATASSS